MRFKLIFSWAVLPLLWQCKSSPERPDFALPYDDDQKVGSSSTTDEDNDHQQSNDATQADTSQTMASSSDDQQSTTGLTAGPSTVLGAPFIGPYPQAGYLPRSKVYSVRIKGQGDQAFQDVAVISDINGYDYAQFGVGQGSVKIEVKNLAGASVENYIVSPQKQQYSQQAQGNTLVYEIKAPQYTVVSPSSSTIGNIMKDQQRRRLVLLAEPAEGEPSSSGDGVFNVRDYPGVKNDGTNISNTTAGIQAAINDAAKYEPGRGRVYVPAGLYVLGNLEIKGDVELYMEKGSVFRYVGNSTYDDYQYKYPTDWTTKGNGTRWISLEPEGKHIKIWGRGTWDGNGLADKGTNFFHQNFVTFNNADVEVRGIIIKNASHWGTVVARSSQVTFDHIKFFQAMYDYGENDGIDVVESQDVAIRNSIAFSFDDSFSVKTYGGNDKYLGLRYGASQSARNIVFDNLIAWTGCHAFKLGQGARQPIDNVTFSNGTVIDAAHAVSLHLKTGSSFMQNSVWDNIDVERIKESNLGNSWLYTNIESKEAGVGIRNITIRNIRIRDFGNDKSTVLGQNDNLLVDGFHFQSVFYGTTGPGQQARSLSDLRVVPNAYVKDISYKN